MWSLPAGPFWGRCGGGGRAGAWPTWVTAFSALATAGDYVVAHEYYRPVPEYIAGFGVMTARTKETHA